MSNLFWLTDAQMARLEPFFPKSHGKPRVDDRRVLSGIILGSDAGEGRIVRYGLVLGPARCKVL
jgi:transposase